MGLFIIVILVLCGLGIALSIGKLAQLNGFAEFMNKEIDAFYAPDNDAYKTTRFDVDKSYDNLFWSMPWNNNFKKMVAYKKVA